MSMSVVVVIFILYMIIFILDLLPRCRKRQGIDTWFYLLAFVLTLTVNLLHGFGVKVPSPASPIKAAVETIFRLK